MPNPGFLGGIATRDGWAADYERRTGESWYAHITKGGKRRPRHTPKGMGLAARGGRVARTHEQEGTNE